MTAPTSPPEPERRAAEAWARYMAARDVLEALVVRLDRWEWPTPELVERARAVLEYRQ